MATATALLIIDVQNDFCDGGSLAVPGGSAVVSTVNALRQATSYGAVILSQDWHPRDHASFASNHPGTAPFQTIELEGVGPQVLWPDHCVQGTSGADFHPQLVRAPDDVVIRKGTQRMIDSYSAFGDALGQAHEKTELDSLLRRRGISRVVLCGLALDYCVAHTAKDAAKAGFDVLVVLPACAGIASDSIGREMGTMAAVGVRFVHDMSDLPAALL